MKRHQYMKIQKKRKEEFAEIQQFNYEKSITRQKHHVDK